MPRVQSSHYCRYYLEIAADAEFLYRNMILGNLFRDDSFFLFFLIDKEQYIDQKKESIQDVYMRSRWGLQKKGKEKKEKHTNQPKNAPA